MRREGLTLVSSLFLLCGMPLPGVAADTHSDAAACSTASAKIDQDFDGGAFSSCEPKGDDHFTLFITPEDPGKINCSPWYAFRIDPQHKAQLTIDLTYETCGHRYWPKLSTDGKTWVKLSEDAVKITGEADQRTAQISLEVEESPVFVAAQELVTPAHYTKWLDRFNGKSFASRKLLGQSAKGRAIEMITLAKNGVSPRETVVIVGRQHPPEVTGAFALFNFVETLAGDSALAKAFRARFETIIVPLLNPDGVALGHWRHNTGGLDLNRDWGPFTQPETQLMQKMLQAIDKDPAKTLRLMLDFHSTNRDVFYTIPDDLPTTPKLYTKKWLDRYQERMTDYTVVRDPSHTVGRPVSKGFIYDTYQVPGVVFEIGDETDRTLIKKIGKQSALAMMETLLHTPLSGDERQTSIFSCLQSLSSISQCQ